MPRIFTREELYELVWSAPVTKVAKDLGISGVALAKRCRRASIPVPPRGYWARVAAGQQIARPPLPPERPPKQPRAAPKVRTAESSSATTTDVDGDKTSPEPRPRRRWRYRLKRGDRLETFWCKLDSWKREYSWGVNWHPWEYNDESWSETDVVTLLGTRRSASERPYKTIEAHLLPTHAHRDKIQSDLDAIGNVWTRRGEKGRLCCSAFVPADAYQSLCGSVSRGDFVEFVVRVRNLTRGRGTTDEISLRPELTDLSDE